MELIDVLEKLCIHDKRNPLYIDDDSDNTANIKCFCDNCFYGRSKLANEILNLLGGKHEL